MKKVTATILTIALVALGAVFVIGQTTGDDKDGKSNFGKKSHRGEFGGRGGGRHGKGMRGGGQMFRNLDLTDAQKEQMKTIGQSSREKMKPIMEQMKANRDQLQQLTSGGNFDEGSVQALAAQQGTLTAQMIVEKERTKAAMFALLTTEQKAKAAEMKAQHEQKRAERKAKVAERKEAKKTEQ